MIEQGAERMVDGIIHYLDAMQARPVFNAVDPAKTNLNFRPETVRIIDARFMPQMPSLAREGFTLVAHRSGVGNFRDMDELEQVYLAEIAEMIREVTGAALVIPSPGPIYRDSASEPGGRQATAGAARFAHTDYTDVSARDHFLPQHLSPGEAFSRFRHITVFQTWRALSGPWQDVPLAVTDGRSVKLEDMVAADAVLGDGYTGPHEENAGFEFSLCRYNPDHRWYYFSQMQPDEVLIFKGYDFDPQLPSRLFHSAFDDHSIPEGTPPRRSVEARTFAFFE